MAYEQKPGDAALFKNKDKQDGDKRPDYSGNGLDLQGNKIRLAGWIKQGQQDDFMSIKISTPMEKQPDVPRSSNPASKFAPSEDQGSMPF